MLPSCIQPSYLKTLFSSLRLHSKILFLHYWPTKKLTHSFWLNLMMATIFNSSSGILSIWIQPFCTKSSTSNSFILTQLDDGSHLEFCNVGFRHCHFGLIPCYLLSDSQKHSSFTLAQTQTNSFWLNLMMATIFNSSILNSAILDSAILHKKNFTHSFWLNLMMAAILNCAMLDSDTAILDSNTLLSSLRFTQKHSPSTLTLSQTNSIWLT